MHWLFVLIVLIAVMPIFVLYVSRLQSNRDAALVEARAHAADLAAAAASVQAGLARKGRHVLEMVAQSPALRGGIGECDRFLNWVQYLISQNERPWMTMLVVTDRNGKGVCGTPPNIRQLSLIHI